MSYRGIGRLFALIAAVVAGLWLALSIRNGPQFFAFSATYAGLAAMAALMVLSLGALFGPRVPWPMVSGAAVVWSLSAAGFFADRIETVLPLPPGPALILTAGLPGAVTLYWLLFVPKGALRWWTLGPALLLPALWIGWQVHIGAPNVPLLDLAHRGAKDVAIEAAALLALTALIWLALRLLDRLFRPLDMA